MSTKAGDSQLDGMEGDFGELRDQLVIDRDRLDNSVIQQPALYFKVGELLSRAVDMRDEAKEDLNVTDAQEADVIRKDFEAQKKSFTKDVIADEVLMSSAHRDAYSYYERCKSFASRVSALHAAYEDRSRMLGLLIKLYGTDYFASSPTRTVDDTATHQVNRAAISKHLKERGKIPLSRRGKT